MSCALAATQREVDLIETDYRKYSANLEQARIDQQLEIERMSNVSVVQPASYEPRPVRPRVALNLLLGLFAGALGGLALPLAARAVRPLVADCRGRGAAPRLAHAGHDSTPPAEATGRQRKEVTR